MKLKKLTHRQERILMVLSIDSSREFYATYVRKVTGMWVGTFYPAMAQLEADGLVEHQVTFNDRHLYKITALGQQLIGNNVN